MSKVFEFAGRMTVVNHIESYWLESMTVCIAMISGEVVKTECANDEDATMVLKNIHDLITDNPHI